MTFENLLVLLGGLALFLYGMHMMSEGLENAAGDKMKMILEKLTSKAYIGVMVGALITAVVQSSSATTVMVVGFVNSSLMTLKQAVWIIMGANIGTTITGQLIALDASKIAPLVAFIGVIMVTFWKKPKWIACGTIFAGLGMLFIGMDMMKNAMVPLQDSEMFISAMTSMSNPFLAVMIGAIFTAAIQSSSASVGILQALAISGLIPLDTAIFIIFGQNIGTCVTAVLASIGTSRGAKRTTIIHLSFNIIGTALFMILASFVPFVDWMQMITSNPAAQIANTHTIFNITTTLLLLPIGSKLADLACLILPITQEEIENNKSYNIPLTFIDINNIGTVPIAISSLRKEAILMLKLAQENLSISIQAVLGQPYNIDKIKKREKRIDYINYEITDYMTKVGILNMSERDSTTINALYKCYADIERIGDHAINIIQYAENPEYEISSRESIKEELNHLHELLMKSFSLMFAYNFDDGNNCYEKIERIEDRIDEITALDRQKQLDRLVDKKVDAKDCVAYSEILTDIERVSDHMLNIIQECKRCNFTLMEDASIPFTQEIKKVKI